MKKSLCLKVSKVHFLTRIFWSGAFLLSVSMSLYGQGTLKGVITDKADNAPLIAATVTVDGTTIGTVTNFNGEYTLPLKAGSYNIHVSYIGYGDEEQEVTIADDRTLEFNVSLGAIAIMGEEVVITMQARGQLAAVNQQLRSNQIINVVSAERIRELPDENAAQAVSRLPGVHLDGSKVVIRGIQPKMNKITINGVEMPSTEQEDRATDLGMISANMLSGIEVVKTLTPDMDADAVGGVVNLRLREAAQDFEYSITAQGGYNAQEKYMGSFKLWGDVSNRFFDKKLGVLLNLNYQKSQSGNDWYSNVFSDFANSTEFWNGDFHRTGINVYDQYNQRTNIGGSLVLDYNLPNGQIIYSGMLTHSASDDTQHRDDLGWGGQRLQYRQIQLSRANYTRLLMNSSLRYEQQIGIVKIDAGVSNVFLDHKDAFRYTYTFSQESTENFVPDSVITKNLRQQGDWDFYDWINPPAEDGFRTEHNRIRPRTFNENHWVADINVNVPVRISNNIDIDFKVGGKYKKKRRDYDEVGLQYYYDNFEVVNRSVADYLINEIGHGPEVESGFFFSDWRDNDYQPNRDYMNNEGARMYNVIDADKMDEMWVNQVDVNPASTPLFSVPDMARNDYFGFETHKAGYIMGEINLGKRLTIIPGIRYEQVHNEYSAPKVEYRSMTSWSTLDTLTKPADHKNWLPHLHLRFSATDWWDIRFSYNNTMTRPDYIHAVPSVYWAVSTGEGEAGNPFIKPATSENLDANFTFYSRKLGLVTIGGFHKTLKDVFYMQETVLKNIPDSTIVAEFPIDQYGSLANGTTDFYINSPFEAKIYGFELEWQSNFNWLRGAWSGLVLNANYTHVWSETKYMLHRINFVVPPGGFLPVPTEADTFYTNRLLHQANDIGNVSLGYDYRGFSARLSFRYQGNVVSKVASLPQLNEYTAKQYKFDFVVKQQIPLKYGILEVFFNAINFTNVPYERFVDYPVQSGGVTTIQRQTTYKRYSGPTYQLGLRFKY
jgi:TonB-dependent receptor